MQTFSAKLAWELGIPAAVIFQILVDLQRCCAVPGAEDHIGFNPMHDGKVWNRMSQEEFIKRVPYIKPSTLKSSLARLISSKIVIRAKFDRDKFNRTFWYHIPLEMQDHYYCY